MRPLSKRHVPVDCAVDDNQVALREHARRHGLRKPLLNEAIKASTISAQP